MYDLCFSENERFLDYNVDKIANFRFFIGKFNVHNFGYGL